MVTQGRNDAATRRHGDAAREGEDPAMGRWGEGATRGRKQRSRGEKGQRRETAIRLIAQLLCPSAPLPLCCSALPRRVALPQTAAVVYIRCFAQTARLRIE